MTKLHEEWFSKAENDLSFAEVGLREGFLEQVCFLSQQAIEKSLKGVLVYCKRQHPKSHNLRELAKKVPELALEDQMEQLIIIDGYYVPLRYPDVAAGTKASGPPSKEEAEQALETARTVLNRAFEFAAKD